MTPQEVFDQIVNGLRAQGSKSIALNEDGTPKLSRRGIPICVYRSPDGKKCGAGQAILDEEYRPDMEGVTFIGLITNTSLDESHVPFRARLAPHGQLITYLQRIHDHMSVENWEEQFENIAYQYNLVYTPPTPKE